MKRISIIICLMLYVTAAYSQLSTGNTFIVETKIRTGGVTDQAGVDALPPDKRTSTVTYLDGLGRSLQKVIVQGSPGLKDMVTPFYFNNFGNNTQRFLSYTDLTGSNYGSIRTTAFYDQRAFYNLANTSAADVAKDNLPITVLRYDESPLNNLQLTGGPGSSWNPDGGHPTSNYYSIIFATINTYDSLLLHWVITSDSGAVPTAELWSPWEAHKMVTINPQGNQCVDVFDINFNHTLRRKYADSVALDTHYSYDDFNRLRFIITPVASRLVIGKTHPLTVDSVPFLKDEMCYYYDYDAKGRVIREKHPGEAIIEMVYDAQERLVYKRDGNLLAKGQWLYYAYDYTGRMTGSSLYLSNISRNALQEKVNGYIYDSIIGNLIMPSPDYTPVLPLTGNQYNTYGSSPDPAFAFVPAEMTRLQSGNSTTADIVTTASKLTNGLKCADWSQVLDSSITLRSSYYYDDKERLIQQVSKNIYGGIDVHSIRYDAEGKVLSSYDHYRNPGSTVTPELKVLTVRYYDDVGNLTQIDKQLNDSGQLKTIVQMRYNSIGQLICKTFGNNLDSMKYSYHIQGWLKSVNKEYLRTGTGNYFGYDLGYDDSTTVIPGTRYLNPLYTGTLAGTMWRSANDNVLRKYDFKYDKIDNLLRADFVQQDPGTSAWSRSLVDYSVSGIKYDLNSNIKSLTQRGLSGTSSIIVDSLKYEYFLNSNKLYFVTDKVNNPLSTLGDFKEANTDLQQDFDYDANGNQYLNMNKLTRVLRYNYLDLPDSIYMWGKGYVVYTYDANGNKLQKAVTDYTGAGKYTTIGYLGDLEFRNDTLQSIAHEEGRIRVIVKAGQPVQYIYDYFEKDQLDNVRVILTEQTDTSIYSASMETALATREENTFSNIAETRSAKPPGYPAGDGRQKNEFVALLSGQPDGKKTGPSLVIRVMAGDTVRIGANAFYKSSTVKKNNPVLPLEVLLNQVLQGASPQAGRNTAHTSLLADQPPLIAHNLTPGSYERLKAGNDQAIDPLRPKAYLNYIYFDDHFKMIEEASGVKQVKATPDQLQELGTDKMVVSRSGYLCVFPSNESQERLYFDNVTVSLTTGPLLEVAHYYPSGLVMDGISSNALKGTAYPENRKKFSSAELQSGEFMDGSSLEWYDFHTFLYDQQIGRLLQSRKPNQPFQEYLSPFHYKFNKPAGYVFPENPLAVPITDILKGRAAAAKVVRSVSILPVEK
ncbi:DUF6443 domain-containing protein [Chitinophaga sp. Cy-1792]|uniref:DUF6443 domain-containing protein n=1 Tax=Chitinophaga sp. Cy-1792 TaxID=2608339 RepID=UPI001423FCA0|nr:DUF6443 domain-containing protein [Chitinophaga sp. Cy-1792]NIG54602.1 hypothetical protein [Chitinophaga sp. Cy-1792]